MRKSVLLILVGFSLLFVGLGVILLLQDAPLSQPTSAVATPPPAGEVARVTVNELHVQLQGPNPPLVWELRIAEAYDAQHIPGSQRIDQDQVASLARGLDRRQAIVILCA